MIVTEEQAKTKWCPMTRSAGFIGTNKLGPAVNRTHYTGTGEDVAPSESQPYSCCIGSRCMMWVPLGPGTTTGYCGMAHK